MSAGAPRGQKEPDPVGLELQAAVSPLTWVPGTELGSSAGVVYSPNHGAISPPHGIPLPNHTSSVLSRALSFKTPSHRSRSSFLASTHTHFHSKTNTEKLEAASGLMAPWLIPHAALAEDLSPAPSFLVGKLTTARNASPWVSNALLWMPGMCAHKYTYTFFS